MLTVGVQPADAAMRIQTQQSELRKTQAKQLIAEGCGYVFKAAGSTRARDWSRAHDCFQRALKLQPDSEQAAKGLAELSALADAAVTESQTDEDAEATSEAAVDTGVRSSVVSWRLAKQDASGRSVSAYVEYALSVKEVRFTVEEYTVGRRFSEFKQLHRTLLALGESYSLAQSTAAKQLFSFSPLTWFDTLDRGFVERRQYWLGVYLKELVADTVAIAQFKLRLFL